MKNVNIQWVTQDYGLFELDWLCELLGVKEKDINIVTTGDSFEEDCNSLIICNHAVNYRYYLDRLRSKSKLYGVFLLSDENLREPCEWMHDPHCKFSVRNYVHFMHTNNPKVLTVGLGYKRGLNQYLKNNKSSERVYNWAFAGTPHGDRKQMVEIFTEVRDFKTHYCGGFGAVDGLTTRAYAEMLNETKFALCPPGQDSMDSFRMYEALEAGCIPVTLRNARQLHVVPTYWHAIFRNTPNGELPFIVGDSWEECKDKVNEVIESGKINTMQTNCIGLWSEQKQVWKTEIQKRLRLLGS